jgi:hypothetical protein
MALKLIDHSRESRFFFDVRDELGQIDIPTDVPSSPD